MKCKSKFVHFHTRKCTWKFRVRNGGYFVSELRWHMHVSVNCFIIISDYVMFCIEPFTELMLTHYQLDHWFRLEYDGRFVRILCVNHVTYDKWCRALADITWDPRWLALSAAITKINGRTLWDRKNGWYFADNIFECIFCNKHHCNWWYPTIGSDMGLAPRRRQAIIWFNDAPVTSCIYETLALLYASILDDHKSIPKVSVQHHVIQFFRNITRQII